MKKTFLTDNELQSYINLHWILYASETFKGKLLRFFYNGVGVFKVVYDGSVIYLGSDMSKALKSFNTVEPTKREFIIK